MPVDVYVGKSRIHGKGVFAAKYFKKGNAVLAWDTSHVVTKAEVAGLSDDERQYVSELEDGRLVVMQPPEKFVNHSCEPNTVMGAGKDIALRDIRKMEEITSDYSSYVPEGWQMRCNCGCKNCRKTIRSTRNATK